MVEHVKSNFVVNILDHFKCSNPDKMIPQNLEDAVTRTEEQYALFESGADAKYRKWKEFRLGLSSNLNSEVHFGSSQELNDTIHNYMDWQKPADELLTDAEKAQYTIENFEMNKRAKLSGFLAYRKEKNNKGFKNIFKDFAEYKAKINEGSFKYFLKSEYKDAAKDVLSQMKEAKRAAENFNIGLAREISGKMNGFEATTINEAKNLERFIFGESGGVKAAKWGGRIAVAAVFAMGLRWAYKFFIADDTHIERSPIPQFASVNDTAKDVNVEKKAAVEMVADTAVKQDEVTDALYKNTVVTDKTESQEPAKLEDKAPAVQVKPKTQVAETKSESKSEPQVAVQKTKPEVQSSKTEVNQPAKTATMTDSLSKAEKRAAFNLAISKIKESLSAENIECDNYTVVKNDTLSRIAIATLKNEGISKPSRKQINERIALIALLNEIEDVNVLCVNQTLKIPSTELTAYIENNEEFSKLISEIAALFA